MSFLPGTLKQKTITEQLFLTRTVFVNGKLEQYQQYLSLVGYSVDKLQEGQKLHEDLSELCLIQTRAANNKKALLVKRDAEMPRLHSEMAILRRLIKEVLKDEPGMIQRVGVHIAQEKISSINKWMAQADLLFRNFSSDHIQKLSPYGITDEKISASRALLSKIQELEKNRLDASSEALRATAERNQALHLFQEWMQRFYNIAPIGFDSEKQQMEGLGILVRS